MEGNLKDESLVDGDGGKSNMATSHVGDTDSADCCMAQLQQKVSIRGWTNSHGEV